MDTESRDHTGLEAHLRAIRSAIVGLALAVLSLAFVIGGGELGFFLAIGSVIVLVYSFVPPVVNSFSNPQ